MLNGRRTLNRARLFRNEAAAVGTGDRERFAAFLEAAIIFGQSVIYHLRKELAGQPGFKNWIEQQVQAMRADALLKFFEDTRGFVIHEAPAGIKKHIIAELPPVVVRVSESVDAQVTRAKPWYRRHPKILWQDFRYPIRRWVNRQKRKLKEWQRRRRAKRQPKPEGRTIERFEFDDPRWANRPALDLLDRYIDHLDRVVADAEARWDSP